MKKFRLLISISIALLFLVPAQQMFATIHFVAVANFNFTPDNIQDVKIGDTIRWVWEGGSHTTTSTTIPAGAAMWDSPINSVTTSFDYVPVVAGLYNYKCTPHAAMGMLGSFTVLDVTGMDVPSALRSVVLYPNPFVDKVSVKMESAQAVECRLTIRDISGRVIMQMPVRVEPGTNVRSIEMDFLNPGIYFFEFTTSSGDVMIRKMIRET
jgi:plastocyanin